MCVCVCVCVWVVGPPRFIHVVGGVVSIYLAVFGLLLLDYFD